MGFCYLSSGFCRSSCSPEPTFQSKRDTPAPHPSRSSPLSLVSSSAQAFVLVRAASDRHLVHLSRSPSPTEALSWSPWPPALLLTALFASGNRVLSPPIGDSRSQIRPIIGLPPGPPTSPELGQAGPAPQVTVWAVLPLHTQQGGGGVGPEAWQPPLPAPLKR